MPGSDSVITSTNLRPRCQTAALLVLYRLSFWGVENRCLLLTLRLEREEKRVFVPLPAPLHLHPTPGDTAVTNVPRRWRDTYNWGSQSEC